MDPLVANDDWANKRAAGLGFAPPQAAAATATPFEAAAAAWKDWQSVSPAASPYTLPARASDRTALIVGRFKPDTDRADIEEVLRKFGVSAEGVDKVAAFGKLAVVGTVTFKDKDAMWTLARSVKA